MTIECDGRNVLAFVAVAFEDVPFASSCQCDEGQLFCATCIQRHIQEQVFVVKTQVIFSA
jgi:hypothetical protein